MAEPGDIMIADPRYVDWQNTILMFLQSNRGMDWFVLMAGEWPGAEDAYSDHGQYVRRLWTNAFRPATEDDLKRVRK